MICIDGGRCLMMSVLCCAAKNVGDVHPSEVEAADRTDVFLPVPVARVLTFLAAAPSYQRRYHTFPYD